MTKQYVNGYSKFRITLVNSSGTKEVYDFSPRYQALKEYYEKISIEQRTISGIIKKKIKYIDHEFRVFYPDAIIKDDLLKFKAIENAEFANKQILITPHIEYPWRVFDVIIIDEKREIDTMPSFGGDDNTFNRGYEIAFKNKYPIFDVKLIDPDYVPVISSESGFEYA